jgi:hypothetical protein
MLSTTRSWLLVFQYHILAMNMHTNSSKSIVTPLGENGFGLLELMLATMIAAGITLGYLYNESRQSAINQAQSQAGYYQMVSDAVAKYMANNYDQLKAITQPKTCSTPQLFTEATAATAPTGCDIKALFLSGSASSPIANGLQPTLTELKNTGYLDANFSNSFLWPTQLTMYAASGVSSGSSYAAPEYRVQIQPWCNGVAPSTDTVCDKPVLHSLVYNAQPFAANTNNSFVKFSRLDKLIQARTALGANAFVSYDWALQKDGLMYSDGNKNQLPNLLKFSSGSNSGVGLEGVLALQGWFTPSSQTASNTQSPTTTSTPTTMALTLPHEVPFSECDPTAETVAVASMTAARVAPISDRLRFHSSPACPDVDRTVRTITNYKNVKQNYVSPYEHWYVTIKGAALSCKLNATAENYSYRGLCQPPEGWRQCVTQREKNITTPFPTHPWVKYKPIDDLNTKKYCWQPAKEFHVAMQKVDDMNPKWDPSLPQDPKFENGPIGGINEPNNSWSLFWWLRYEQPPECTQLMVGCEVVPIRMPR